jgi:hypothetical protein
MIRDLVVESKKNLLDNLRIFAISGSDGRAAVRRGAPQSISGRLHHSVGPQHAGEVVDD